MIEWQPALHAPGVGEGCGLQRPGRRPGGQEPTFNRLIIIPSLTGIASSCCVSAFFNADMFFVHTTTRPHASLQAVDHIVGAHCVSELRVKRLPLSVPYLLRTVPHLAAV